MAFYAVLAIPAIASTIYKKIKPTAISGAFIIGTIGLAIGGIFFKRKINLKNN